MNSENEITELEIDRIEDKIKRLKKFYSKYPNIRKNSFAFDYYLQQKDEEEQVRFIQEFERIKNDYYYVSKRRDYLSDSVKEELKECGVGGFFGYPKRVEADIQKLQDLGLEKSQIEYIISNYGNLGNFSQIYLQGLFQNKKKRQIIPTLLLSKNFKWISNFDISETDLIEKDGYCRLVKDIYKIEGPVIIHGDSVSQEINKQLSLLKTKYLDIIKKYYGIMDEERKLSYREIGNFCGLSFQRIRELHKKILIVLKENINMDNMIFITDKKVVENFFKKYFEENLPFYVESNIKEELKSELLGLVYSQMIVQNSDFRNYRDEYFSRDLDIELYKYCTNLVELNKLKKCATRIVSKTKEKIDNNPELSEDVKIKTYENLYNNPDFIKILIEGDVPDELYSKKDDIEQYFKGIEKIINHYYKDDITVRTNLLNLLNLRIDFVHNGFASRLEEDMLISFWEEKLYNVPIEHLDLSHRTYNAAKRNDINIIGDWFRNSRNADYNDNNGLGKKSYMELEIKIDEFTKLKLYEFSSMVKKVFFENGKFNLDDSDDITLSSSGEIENDDKKSLFLTVIKLLKNKYKELEYEIMHLKKAKKLLNEKLASILSQRVESIQYIEYLENILQQNRSTYGGLTEFKELREQLRQQREKLNREEEEEENISNQLIEMEKSELDLRIKKSKFGRQIEELEKTLE